MQGETVWLSLEQMAELFERDKSTISRHIKNIFDEGELLRESTFANFATVQNEGSRQVERMIDYYNLDVIISVGYRMVQNKLHFAAHGHTAAELIYERADANKPFTGLTTFSGYFDFAEVQAMRRHVMHMSDYVEHLDNLLKSTGEKLLEDAGTVSHVQVMEKAKEESKKYQVENLSPVEEAYLQTIKEVEKTA